MIEKWLNNDQSIKRWRRFKRNKLAVISVWVIIIISFFSFTAKFWANNRPILLKHHGEYFSPVMSDSHPSVFGIEDQVVTDYRTLPMNDGDWAIWPMVRWNAFESNAVVERYPSPPTRDNWFGTDDSGRDVFTRLLYGYRYSIGYAFGVWLLAYMLGTAIGALMGYLGGVSDIIGSRVVEVLEMTPTLLLLITIISIFTPNIILLIIFSALFEWTFIYHYMRSQFLQLRKRDFVEAAKALGSGHGRIIFKHILPNALTPLITFSPFAIAANIYSLSILDYLGLGLQAPTPSWGELMSQAQKYFSTAEWLVYAPSAALLITMTALINIGLAVRDAYDSKM